MADSVAPRLSAEECLDNISNKMELQQLIGILQASHSINGEMLLVIGSTGMLVVGGAVAAYERIIVAYLCLKSREMGMDRFVNRLFHVGDTLQVSRLALLRGRGRGGRGCWRTRGHI